MRSTLVIGDSVQGTRVITFTRLNPPPLDSCRSISVRQMDLDRRLLEHDSEFNLFRATHLCAHSNYYDYGAFGRLAEERDLIELWQPACNSVTASALGERTQHMSVITTSRHGPDTWKQRIELQL
jgi:hypothetical protein